MQPNKPQKKRFRSALLLTAAVLVVAAATAAGAFGWVASAQQSVEDFFQRDEFRALAAVLSTTQPEMDSTTPAAQVKAANLTQASLCWWNALIH